MSQLSFADQIVNSSRKKTRSQLKLEKLNALIDWRLILELVKSCFPKSRQGGRPPKDLGIKTRMLFLQHLYNLSDPELEDQLNDRLSFQRFCGIPLSEEVIDFTTFWRFKERLAEQGLPSLIFEQINAHLEDKGLFVKQGTIVDASIIASSGRPLSDKKREELAKNLPARLIPMPAAPGKGACTTLATRVILAWMPIQNLSESIVLLLPAPMIPRSKRSCGVVMKPLFLGTVPTVTSRTSD